MLGSEAACRQGCGQQEGHRGLPQRGPTHLFCKQAWLSDRPGGCEEQSAWRPVGRRGSAWQGGRDEAKVLQLLSFCMLHFLKVLDRAVCEPNSNQLAMNALVGTQAPGSLPSIRPRRRCKCSRLSADARYSVMSADNSISSRFLQKRQQWGIFSDHLRMHHNTRALQRFT